MSMEIYNQLREKIDQYSVGMFPTKSGEEIEILKRLFTEDEATVYIGMTRSLEPPETIGARAGIESGRTKEILDAMTEKGLTFPKTKDGKRYYAAAPFMHGFFEHQIFRKEKDPEIAPLFDKYIMGGFIPRKGTLRTVPVMTDVDTKDVVLPFDDVKAIINSKERIGLFQCACNYQYNLAQGGCGKDGEVCIAFDFYAEYVIEEMKFGKWITKEEALKVLEKSEELGFVHQTAGDTRNVEAICNCCPDCCTIFRKIKMLPNPAMFKQSNYILNFDSAKCTSCEACIDKCPMGALAMNDASLVDIDRGKCIGCGICSRACPSSALALTRKPDDKIKAPPEKFEFMRSTIDLMNELDSIS